MTYEAIMMRHLPSWLIAALAATALIPPSGFGQVVGERAVAHTPIEMTPTNPNPLAPHLVVNEVLFDNPGAAGSEGAYQWVELYASQSVDLTGINVESASGQPLVGLPPVTVPAGTHIVALLGPTDTSLDNLDPEQGPIVITAGLAWADYLGVSQGGVRITRNAKLLDSLSWSTTPPSDAFFDLGAQPIYEGDSLGRSASGVYSGKATDFAGIC